MSRWDTEIESLEKKIEPCSGLYVSGGIPDAKTLSKNAFMAKKQSVGYLRDLKTSMRTLMRTLNRK